MKKFLLAIGAVAFIAGLTGCKDAANSSANYSESDKLFGDSVSTALGEFAGAQENSQLQSRLSRMSDAEKAKFDKEEYLRGVEYVLGLDTANVAYVQGLQFGLQLVQPIIGISQQTGIPMNANIVKKAFRQTYLKDSIGDVAVYYGNYEVYMRRLQEIMQQRQEEAKQNSPEAKANLAAGKAYIDSIKAADPAYQTTESGLVYKIENPGTDPKVQGEDGIEIRYAGKFIDGKVFDQTADGKTYKSKATSFIPGFNEGLQLLGKGGKATLVIPSELAYGVNGAGSAIGPNATLVFDIEVVDITPAGK